MKKMVLLVKMMTALVVVEHVVGDKVWGTVQEYVGVEYAGRGRGAGMGMGEGAGESRCKGIWVQAWAQEQVDAGRCTWEMWMLSQIRTTASAILMESRVKTTAPKSIQRQVTILATLSLLILYFALTTVGMW
ncbi:hypothetical protein V8D89_006630 [Ganoderma adspersum]